MHAHAPPGAPRLEIATIFRTRGGSFRQKHRLSPWAGPWLEGHLGRALLAAIEVAAEGGGGLARQEWFVYAKKPFGRLRSEASAALRGPEQIVSYLVALSNSRLLSVSDARITFRTRGEGQRGRARSGGRALCAGCVRWLEWASQRQHPSRPGREALWRSARVEPLHLKPDPSFRSASPNR